MPIISADANGDLSLYESDFDSWIENCSRVLVNGPPLTGKTTSFMTFPGPRHVIVAPREQGHSSIREDKDTKIYTWKFPTVKDASKYQQIWRSVVEITEQIIAGEFGPVRTICIDGLHKLYYCIQKAHGYVAGTDSREYGRYHEVFISYLDTVLSSSVSHVVASCYDGQEPMEDDDGTGKKKMGVFAALPGRMAKEIMGVFPLVFHTERFLKYAGGKATEEYRWQFRMGEKIQGAGGHLPLEIREAFPAYFKPDWNEVVALIKKQTKIDINQEIENASAPSSIEQSNRKARSTAGKAANHKVGRRK